MAIPGTTNDLARTRLSDQLVVRLGREIVSGELPPGAAVPTEHELATTYGVSKPVVRESLRALVALGLVHAHQGKRTLVQDASQWNVLDPLIQEAYRLAGRGRELADQLFELRLILETSSASRAAERASAEQLRRLQELVTRMRAVTTEDRDRATFLEADREFHDVIAQASGNEALRQVIRNVNGYLAYAWSQSSIDEDELELLTGLHTTIAEAIAAGDPAAAATAMNNHLGRAAAKVIELSADDEVL